MRLPVRPIVAVALLGIACGPTQTSEQPADARSEVASTRLEVTSAEAQAILDLVNDPEIDVAALDIGARLDKRAAANVIAHRNGRDGRPGTTDDRRFKTIDELDAVPYVGATALKRLLGFAIDNGYRGAAPEPIGIPVRQGVRFSANVFTDVAREHGITDGENLLERALTFDDGNGYLNTSELEAAAAELAADAALVRDIRYAASVLRNVMSTFGVRDRLALLAEALRHDADDNGYLKRAELESATRSLGAERIEFGVVSDIDRTVLPPYRGDAMPAPYPGVVHLLRQLDMGHGGRAGDTWYVTARPPDRIAGLDEWMSAHDLPHGPIEPGIAPQPWLAEPEKVADISRIFDANPDQAFVLFGDSNHRDPEVYKTIIDTYGDRVLAAFIHRVNNVAPERLDGLVGIRNYTDAAAHLLRIGVLDESAARRVMRAAQSEGLDISDEKIDFLIRSNAAMD